MGSASRAARGAGSFEPVAATALASARPSATFAGPARDELACVAAQNPGLDGGNQDRTGNCDPRRWSRAGDEEQRQREERSRVYQPPHPLTLACARVSRSIRCSRREILRHSSAVKVNRQRTRGFVGSLERLAELERSSRPALASARAPRPLAQAPHCRGDVASMPEQPRDQTGRLAIGGEASAQPVPARGPHRRSCPCRDT